MHLLKSKQGKAFGLLTVLHRDLTRLDRVYYICKCVCGTIKSVRSDHIGKDTVSCGCYNTELIRKSREGVHSSTFKSSKGRLIFYKITNPLYKEIRIRDDNQCVLCGKKTGLHIHHILRKSKYPEYVFEPSNLVTMCDNCHFWDAHLGNTNLINLELSIELVNIVFKNTQRHPINEAIAKKVKEAIKKLKGL